MGRRKLKTRLTIVDERDAFRTQRSAQAHNAEIVLDLICPSGAEQRIDDKFTANDFDALRYILADPLNGPSILCTVCLRSHLPLRGDASAVYWLDFLLFCKFVFCFFAFFSPLTYLVSFDRQNEKPFN